MGIKNTDDISPYPRSISAQSHSFGTQIISMPEEQSQGTRRAFRPAIGHSLPRPIGHPDDLTVRALTILRRVDLVATRIPGRRGYFYLTMAFMLPSQPTIGTMRRRADFDRADLGQGRHIALISDCGMPALYDPGRLLITRHQQGYISRWKSFPGPSIVTAAATLCSMDTNAFVFEGRCTGTLAVSRVVFGRYGSNRETSSSCRLRDRSDRRFA